MDNAAQQSIGHCESSAPGKSTLQMAELNTRNIPWEQILFSLSHQHTPCLIVLGSSRRPSISDHGDHGCAAPPRDLLAEEQQHLWWLEKPTWECMAVTVAVIVALAVLEDGLK